MPTNIRTAAGYTGWALVLHRRIGGWVSDSNVAHHFDDGKRTCFSHVGPYYDPANIYITTDVDKVAGSYRCPKCVSHCS